MYVINSHSRQTRILLVDDSDIVRAALRRLLESNFEVVGEARDGREAVTCCQELQPDIVLLDISLPDASGFRLIKDILRCSSHTRTIFVSTHASKEYVNEAFRRGAFGYVVKGNASRELITAINIAVAGCSIHHSTQRVESTVLVGAPCADHVTEAPKPVLSARGSDAGTLGPSRFPLSVCAEGRQFFTDFAQAVVEVVKLLQNQLNAVMNGDLAANRFDLLIHEANERKQDAKYSYLHHLHTHGCDAADGLEHCGS
jgi:DNA-binding NarL/FixJ family response regulator